MRIGTRGSPLARAQAGLVRDLLHAAHPGMPAPELVVIRTTGDRIRDRPLADVGGKGLFTKEIEEALATGAVDLAVHSMKDMETRLPDGLAIDCLLPREDPRDALFTAPALGPCRRIDALPEGARLGTSSLRRAAQALARRPDLAVAPMRGNVETRLEKLARGEADATLLAVAGLKRLGLAARIEVVLAPEDMLPAVGQGAIGVERRAGDDGTRALLAPIGHAETAVRVRAERAFLAALDGSCRTPIAALAEVEGDELRLRGLVASPDGQAVFAAERRGPVGDAEALGRDAAGEIRAAAGPGFFAALA